MATRMNILESTFFEEKRQEMGGCSTIYGRIRNDKVLFQANCTLMVSLSAFSLKIETENKSILASIQINKFNRNHMLPYGHGTISINGRVVAHYISAGIIRLKDGTKLQVFTDNDKRRFLWARAHGCTYDEANQYAYHRNAILTYGQLPLASFVGNYNKSSWLSPNDLRQLHFIPESDQWCILALCLMQNVYYPKELIFLDSGKRQQSVIGESIPDIPSFVRLFSRKNNSVSVRPEDTIRGIRLWDKILFFICSKYQYSVGFPFYVLSILMIRTFICVPFSLWEPSQFILFILWSTMFIIFVKFLIFRSHNVNIT